MKPEYWDRAKRTLARRDPVLAGIMRRHPRVHLVARGEPFQTLARAIVGQQISVKAAQSVWNRVLEVAPGVTPGEVLAVKRPACAPAGCPTARRNTSPTWRATSPKAPCTRITGRRWTTRP